MKSHVKSFYTISFAQLISSVGSGITAFSLAIYVFKTEQTLTSISLITLAAFLPIVLCSPFGGTLADKYDRKVLMIISDGCSIIGLLVMLLFLSLNQITLYIIIGCVFFNAIFGSLLEPTYKALVSDLLTKEEYTKGSGLIQLSSAAKFLFVPILAGMLYMHTSISIILWIDISTFLITISSLLLIRKQHKQEKTIENHTNILSSLQSSIKTTYNMKGVFHLVLLLSLVTFCIGYYQTLYTPLLLSFTNEFTLGWIQSLGAVGWILASLYYSIKTSKYSLQDRLVTGLLLMSGSIFIVGAVDSLVTIAIAGFFLFVSIPFVNISAEVMIRSSIPNKMQGRIWGIIGFLSQIGYLVAYISSGPLTDYVLLPLFKQKTEFTTCLVTLIGSGTHRVIGLVFMMIGIIVFLTSILVRRDKEIQHLAHI